MQQRCAVTIGMGVGVLSLCLLGGVRQVAGLCVGKGVGGMWARAVRATGPLMFEVGFVSPKSGSDLIILPLI